MYSYGLYPGNPTEFRLTLRGRSLSVWRGLGEVSSRPGRHAGGNTVLECTKPWSTASVDAGLEIHGDRKYRRSAP
jgi:hypothetical protein